MKKVNHTLIKSKSSYQFNELAELLGVEHQTVRNWHRTGMKVLKEDSRPYLVMGFEARRFLSERKAKRKIELNKGEFLCPRCMCSRKSKRDKMTIEKTGRILGTTEQIIVKGVCEICDSKMIFFTTERKIAEHTSILIGSDRPSVILSLGRY